MTEFLRDLQRFLVWGLPAALWLALLFLWFDRAEASHGGQWPAEVTGYIDGAFVSGACMSTYLNQGHVHGSAAAAAASIADACFPGDHVYFYPSSVQQEMGVLRCGEGNAPSCGAADETFGPHQSYGVWVAFGYRGDTQGGCEAGGWIWEDDECHDPAQAQECANREGQARKLGLAEFPTGTFGHDGCEMDSHGVSVCLGGSCLVNAVYTGDIWTSGDETPTADLGPGEGDLCATGPSGLQYCQSAERNCGFLNGEWVCLRTVAGSPSGCVTSGGELLCVEDVTAPPAPDDGVTPGVRAAPDETLGVHDGLNGSSMVLHFNSSTIANSSGATGGEQDGGGGGVGEGDDALAPVGEVSGGEGCAAAPSCSGDGIQCAILRQIWEARCAVTVSSLPGPELISEVGLDEFADRSALEDGVIDVQGFLDDAGFLLGSRACPADQQVDAGAMIGTLTVPLSTACGLFQLTGWLIMFGAGLVSVRIVAGGL